MEEILKSNILELGPIAIIFIFAVREFFQYLKTKKQENGNGFFNVAILDQLKSMNNNHLHSIQQSIEHGNKEIVDSIHQDNMKIIELLGEIKGKLSK